MPAIFVSGVPETAAIRDGLRRRLSRESTALSLPGFDCPRSADGIGSAWGGAVGVGAFWTKVP